MAYSVTKNNTGIAVGSLNKDSVSIGFQDEKDHDTSYFTTMSPQDAVKLATMLLTYAEPLLKK